MNLAILATHYTVFAIVTLACRLSRERAHLVSIVASGVLGLPVFGLLTLAMLITDNHAGNGTTGAWFLIYSIVTLGVVPAITLTSAALSGVFASRVWHLIGRQRARRRAAHDTAKGAAQPRFDSGSTC